MIVAAFFLPLTAYAQSSRYGEAFLQAEDFTGDGIADLYIGASFLRVSEEYGTHFITADLNTNGIVDVEDIVEVAIIVGNQE